MMPAMLRRRAGGSDRLPMWTSRGSGRAALATDAAASRRCAHRAKALDFVRR
jgi:hypothetical protein